MEAGLVSRAVAAATSLAGALELRVDDAELIHSSNRLALRLLPCDVLARVALVGQEVAALEVELTERLAATESPVAALEPRVEPRVYERGGFAMTFWTYYEVVTGNRGSPAEYADALHRLHAGMRRVEVSTPHFLERVADAERLVTTRDETPMLAGPDRDLLPGTLHDARQVIQSRRSGQQLLHGEPHPGNLLSTQDGLTSSTSKRVAVGQSSSTLLTCRKRPGPIIRMSITSCSRNVGGLFLRWWLRGDGTSTTSSRMGGNTAETSWRCSARVHRGRLSELSTRRNQHTHTPRPECGQRSLASAR